MSKRSQRIPIIFNDFSRFPVIPSTTKFQKRLCLSDVFFSINTLRNWYIYVHDWLIFFWQIYTVRPNAWIPIKLVFQTALEATEAEETLSGSQVKYNIYIIRIYSSLGTQNHAKWRFYTLNIWVITPKNEGLGFPWLVPQNLTWIPDTRQIAI